jgi:hypothetical protein
LESFIKNYSPEACTQIKEAWARVVSHFSPDDTTSNVVWLAGKTVQMAFKYLRSDGIIPAPTSSFVTGCVLVHVFSEFVTFEAVHPSHHLMLGRAPEAERIFKETCGIFKALRQGCRTRIEIDAYLGEDFVARHQNRLHMCALLEIPHVDGWIHDDYRHLRHVHESLLTALLSFKARVGDAVFRCCCQYSVCHVNESYITAVEYFIEELKLDNFARFMCDGVAARLDDAKFVAELKWWLAELGPAKLATFMCGSVATRLLVPGFVTELKRWLAELGPAKFATFMSRDSVAARLKDDAFVGMLGECLKISGAARFVQFMSNGVASRLLDVEFVACLDWWLVLLGLDAVARFMSRNSAAPRLLEPNSVVILVRWWAKLGSDVFTKFVVTGVAARLHIPAFVDMFDQMMESTVPDAFKTIAIKRFKAGMAVEEWPLECQESS